VFGSNAAYGIAHTHCHHSVEEFLAILGYPHEMDLEVGLRVRS
jgi:hypothetical protein